MGLAVGMFPSRCPAKPNPWSSRIAVHAMWVQSQQHAAQQSHVFKAAADDPQSVEIMALHLDTNPAELAKARLIADHAAERCRTDHRAPSLRAERQWHLEICDRCSRTARRAARRMGG